MHLSSMEKVVTSSQHLPAAECNLQGLGCHHQITLRQRYTDPAMRIGQLFLLRCSSMRSHTLHALRHAISTKLTMQIMTSDKMSVRTLGAQSLPYPGILPLPL